ncbi:DUF6777 domain-containing protein [Actinocorallia aurantiaca]|uniref:DUF6777 domain-containing protein n=1 Tax=Actinocorallia aurantiaca TaxID=46204 RepID=A0ABP6GQT8_9ACTN
MSTKTRTAIIALFLTLMSVTACGEAGRTITRLAVGDPGPDPYTLAASADDDAEVDRRAASGGEVKGDAPGLYGGTRKASSCDKAALVEFLQVNTDKAGAWAGALGIAAGEIPAFVEDLTPAVLRVDTLVTNHGYRNGTATGAPAVLQAGVAVLVDRKGMPVVKCNCGNPLTPPDEEIDPKDSKFKGASWPQFNSEKVTVIETPAQEVETLTLVDSESETAFERPVGTGGDEDGEPEPIPAAARSEPPVSTSGQPTGGPSTDGPGRSGTPGKPTKSGAPTIPGESAEPEESTPSVNPGDGVTEGPASEPATADPQKPESPKTQVEETAETGETGGTTEVATRPAEAETTRQEPEQPEKTEEAQPASKEPEPGPGPEVTAG